MTDEINVSSEQQQKKSSAEVVDTTIKNYEARIKDLESQLQDKDADLAYMYEQRTNNIEPVEVVEDGPSKADLEKILLDPESTNLQIITASLKHREIVLRETGKDEYAASVAKGQRYEVHPNQLLEAEQTAQALQDLVDQCNGDEDVFNTLIKKAGGPTNKFIK